MGSFGAVDPWTLATSWRKQVIQFVMIECLNSLVLQMQGVSIPPTYASTFSSIAANGSDWWSLVITFSVPYILASMLQGITLKPRMVSPPSVATDALKLLEFLVDRHPHQVAWVFVGVSWFLGNQNFYPTGFFDRDETSPVYIRVYIWGVTKHVVILVFLLV